jgi:hypothetical protein
LQSLFAARGLAHLEAQLGKRWAQGAANGRLVVDNEDARGYLNRHLAFFR